MVTIEDARKIIENEIKNLSLPAQPVGLYEPIHYILAFGGKRLRPVMVLLGCDMFGGNIKDAIPASIAIEIFHNFTLVHDDIMDNAMLRRNKPPVHVKWNNNTGILSGDAMQIIASQLIAKINIPEVKSLIHIFNQTALQVCEGQQYDMDFEQSDNVSVKDYLEMIRLKTAVLLAASLQIGAIIGGAQPSEHEKIYKFGENIGLGFQLQDDLLDVFADMNQLGKEIGKDIVSNKKTYLLLKTKEDASIDDLKYITHLLNQNDFTPEDKINKVTELYKKYSIKEKTETLIEQYFKQAMQCLYDIEIPDEKKTILMEFLTMVNSRVY